MIPITKIQTGRIYLVLHYYHNKQKNYPNYQTYSPDAKFQYKLNKNMLFVVKIMLTHDNDQFANK